LSVRIRLRRVGAKKQPSYRVVVADSRAPRDGRFIDVIGFYNPRTKPTTITINEDKARKWLSQGALPTESVASLFYRAGIVDMRSARYRKEGDVMQGAAAATAEPQATAAPVAPEAPAASATPEETAAGEAELAAES